MLGVFPGGLSPCPTGSKSEVAAAESPSAAACWCSLPASPPPSGRSRPVGSPSSASRPLGSGPRIPVVSLHRLGDEVAFPFLAGYHPDAGLIRPSGDLRLR